jgi:hypothetical protein
MDKITTYDYYSFMHRRVTFTKVDHKQNEISTRVATGWDREKSCSNFSILNIIKCEVNLIL